MAFILRTILKGFLPTTFVLLTVILIGQLILDSRSITFSKDRILRLTTLNELSEYKKLKEITRERINLYEEYIEELHLVDGMLVNRHPDGTYADICDSLLFSSLRYVALHKLGYKNKSILAWTNLSKSQKDGKWFRHPTCQRRTSRDMMIGVLAALTQFPPNGKSQLELFFKYLENNGGYFGDGPMYVSYMTPGVAEGFRNLAKVYNIKSVPSIIDRGFSTVEINSMFVPRGYQAHLIALQIWIEIELEKFYTNVQNNNKPRSVITGISPFLSPFTIESIDKQRRYWIAQKLYKLDHNNLFFKWLLLRSSDKLSIKSKFELLKELNEMPQFPVNRLPRDCDRKADYLWQRDSIEYQMTNDHCHRFFNGIDFIWMASLIMSD